MPTLNGNAKPDPQFLLAHPKLMRRVVSRLMRCVNFFHFILIFLVIAACLGAEFVQAAPKTNADQTRWDQRAAALGRSYPIGVQAAYSLGYNVKLWQDDRSIDDPKHSWKYGYFRLATNMATSAVINRIGLEAQWFPISIFGISLGHDWGLRHFKPPFAECKIYECMGLVKRAYLRGQFVAAASGWVLSIQSRYDQLTHQGFNSTRFFDEMTLLNSQTPRERVFTFNPVLLYTLTDRYRVGMISLFSHGIDSGDTSHLWGPVTQISFNTRTSMILGAGQNSATSIHSALGVFVMLNHVIQPSMAIQDLKIKD